jgi:hypothetical protein
MWAASLMLLLLVTPNQLELPVLRVLLRAGPNFSNISPATSPAAHSWGIITADANAVGWIVSFSLRQAGKSRWGATVSCFAVH